MALLSNHVGRPYAHGLMPAVKTGQGPWGDAIKYWLPRRNMRQADLARVTGIEEKTISSMARGFHTTTRKLEAVAKAFGVPIDEVLVSPNRQLANEDRKREIQEAVEAALRNIDERGSRRTSSLDQAMTTIEHAIEQREQPTHGQQATLKPATAKPKIQKRRRTK